jgi:hypothetical protein
MLIIYNSNFKAKNLKNICKVNNLKNYSLNCKSELLTKLNQYKAVVYIQTFFRKKIYEEYTCPITLDKLKYPFISIKKSNNDFRYYSLEAFVEYLNKSNGLIDPISREILSDNTINNLEYLVKYYKIKSKFNNKNWKKKIDLRAEYLTLTTCLNEVINQIFSNDDLSIEFIYNEIIPQFIYYFNFLLNKHKSSCYSLIKHYINCLNHHKSNNKNYVIYYLSLIISMNNL